MPGLRWLPERSSSSTMATTCLGGCEDRAVVAFFVLGEMRALECANMGADDVGKAFC